MRQLPAAAVVENGNQWCHRVLFHPWCMCYVCASTAACSVCVTNLCVTTPRVNPTWTLRTCMCTRNTGPIGDAVVYLEEKLVRCPHLHNRRATASSTAPTPRPCQPFAITLICTVVAPAQAARSTAGRYLRSRMPVLDGRGAENALAPASAATVHASLAICHKTMGRNGVHLVCTDPRRKRGRDASPTWGMAGGCHADSRRSLSGPS